LGGVGAACLPNTFFRQITQKRENTGWLRPECCDSFPKQNYFFRVFLCAVADGWRQHRAPTQNIFFAQLGRQ
jgi:hypothetical protein